jgi:2-polyprenyl-6-hydroxyphenyl methylase/3-demethylubiquinone-9 3-methyltransferase
MERGQENTAPAQASSRDQREIDAFSAIAQSWWDPTGPFAPLHHLNPSRVRILANCAADHFHLDLKATRPFNGLSLLDIGCGGGLIAEPFSKLGFDVTGVDASPQNIETARAHAADGNLSITYLEAAPEDSFLSSRTFDVVLALEVIEHVADLDLFLSSVCSRVKPGGVLFLSTLNRTLRSLVLGKAVAEYVLGWVPPGTHTWSKFVKPSEIAKRIRTAGFAVTSLQGLEYELATGEWRISEDVSVNYILAATRQ